jgi:hypothetical protein
MHHLMKDQQKGPTVTPGTLLMSRPSLIVILLKIRQTNPDLK